jgi:MoaA/NifB/PqqE/SkfB family radical SAM enzyme
LGVGGAIARMSLYLFYVPKQELMEITLLKGRHEGKIESAENSLKLGLSTEISAKISGLTIPEVTKIAERLGIKAT